MKGTKKEIFKGEKMVLTKLIRQYGRYGNKYSLLEVGDTVNALLDVLKEKKVVEVEADEKIEAKSAVKKPTPKAKKNRVGEVVRTRGSGDRVYYVLKGKRQWVENPDILRKLGFDFSDVNEIEDVKLTEYDEGTPIDDRLGIKKEEPEKKEEVKKEEGGETKVDKYNL